MIKKWISELVIDRDAIIAVRKEMAKIVESEDLIQNKAVKKRIFAFLTEELSRTNKRLGI